MYIFDHMMIKFLCFLQYGFIIMLLSTVGVPTSKYALGSSRRGSPTWKLWMGLGVGSQVERGFSWERKGPLKAWVMALRLKAHTADAAMLLLYGQAQQGRRRYRRAEREQNKSKSMISAVIFRTVDLTG